MIDLYNQFLDKVIHQTEEGLLEWDSIDTIIDKFNVIDFDFILFINEFHQINVLNSYGIVNDELNIFLLDEVFESGKDGSISEELNLYVVKGINGKSFKVPIDAKGLRHLQETINQSFKSKNNLDSLLKKYIENN